MEEAYSLHETLPFLFGIIIVIVLVEMLATKLKIAYPILLVLTGLLISFIPSLPRLRLDPDMVFFIILPPLLYEASWSISLKEMKKWWRIIGSFAFLVVFFTAFIVAVVTNSVIPGFTLALGFLLGGIVGPPDAVSAGAILKFVKVPKQTSTILEGESLLNDASSLIIFRFALLAITTGYFSWADAATGFAWMVFGGVGIGLGLGWIFKKAHQIFPLDTQTNIAVTLITPYILYWVAEQLHSSGVLAVVFGGLYLSANRLRIFDSESRLKSFSFWESFVFILNGLVFFLIGLDLPEIVSGLQKDGISISTAFGYGVLVTSIVVLVRIISSYIAMVSTFLFRRSVIRAGNFNRRNALLVPLFLGWTGMRGVVSLAAALSIPIYLANGEQFPQRHLILFISFIVIILTLFVQGLTLPFIISRMKLFGAGIYEDKNIASGKLKLELRQHLLDYLENSRMSNVCSQTEMETVFKKWREKVEAKGDGAMSEETKELYLQLLESQRNFLVKRNEDPLINEDLIRKEIYLLDLEEERIKSI